LLELCDAYIKWLWNRRKASFALFYMLRNGRDLPDGGGEEEEGYSEAEPNQRQIYCSKKIRRS
jgi:hypothetical protein